MLRDAEKEKKIAQKESRHIIKVRLSSKAKKRSKTRKDTWIQGEKSEVENAI